MTDDRGPRLRVAFAGTPGFAATALEALLASRHHLVGVLTQPDRPAGRGRRLEASPVKRLAADAGLPVLQPATLREPDAVAALAALGPEVLVVAAYGLLLPPSVLALPPLGCLNIHASLLPRWRGAAPIQRAILAGDAITGISLMQMDEGLDTGAVWQRRELAIGAGETAGELHDRLAAAGATLLLEVLDDRARGAGEAVPQPGEGASYAERLDKREARLDFGEPANRLARRVRAFDPWPVAEAWLEGERLRLRGARALEGSPEARAARPGTVLGVVDGALQVRAGKGVLAVSSLQRPGRRTLPAVELVRGMDIVGRVFD